MAERVQVILPPEMTPLFAEIKAVRAKEFEPLSNTSIVIDAVKAYYRTKVGNNGTSTQNNT